MDSRFRQLREIFEQALDLPAEERTLFLTDACGDDAKLRAEIEELLANDDDRPSDLETFELPLESLTAPGELRLAADTDLGPFRIIRWLASGGMGHVYEAEQDVPRRRIALKVLRNLLASGPELRRFRYESETLAQLQHPGIARVFSVGTHRSRDFPAGELPFFAMELVEGAQTLLRFVESRRLDRTDRLALFDQVAAAIQFGHSRGVLHRDIKPANLLVDTSGHVKVIDFGLARAIGVTGEEALSGRGGLAGTPSYMPPEQFDGEILDVRSDVYALGVVLYELLVNRLPYDWERTPIFEIPRRLRESTPRRPSEFGQVPDELEWIVLKAIDADPERRYASVASLREDLARFAANEPVQAGPATARYRARKFIRRHRAPVFAAALVSIALVAGLIGVTLALGEVREQFRQKQQAVGFFTEMFTDIDPEIDGRDARLFDVVARWAPRIEADFEDQPAVRLLLHEAVGRVFDNLGFHAIAEPHLEAAFALSITREGRAETLATGPAMSLASNRFLRGRLEEAAELAKQVLDARQHSLEASDSRLALSMKLVGLIRREQGDFRAARDLLRTAHETARQNDPASGVTLRLAAQLGSVHVALAEWELAARVLEPALETAREAGADAAALLALRNHLAVLRIEQGRAEEAEGLLRTALEESSRAYGEDHPERLRLRHNLGRVMAASGRPDEAKALFEDVITKLRVQLGAEHVDTQRAEASLAILLYRLGEMEDAERRAEEVYAKLKQSAGESHPETLAILNAWVALLTERGELEPAAAVIKAALDRAAPVLGSRHPVILQSRVNLAAIRLKQDRSDEAETILKDVLDQRRALGQLGRGDLTLLNNLARALLDQGEAERAEGVLAELIRLSEQAGFEDDQALIPALSNRASVLAALGRRAEAAEQHRAILAIRETSLGDDHPATILSLNNLGVNLQKLGQLEEAIDIYARAARAIERTPALDPVTAAQCLFNYGALLKKLGHDAEAKTVLRTCLETFERRLGADDPWTKDTKGLLTELGVEESER